MPKGVPLDLSSGTKHCARCDTTKPLDQFHRTKATKHGYSVYCAICSVKRHDAWRRSNLPQAAKNAKKWRRENPKLARDHELKSRYGLPLGEYDRMHAAQNGLCAICGKPSTTGRGALHVDHCHSSGCIRGLLCHGCNVSIGHFNHDPKILEAAIRYLSRT
jgi:hypothetical protein